MLRFELKVKKGKKMGRVEAFIIFIPSYTKGTAERTWERMGVTFLVMFNPFHISSFDRRKAGKNWKRSETAMVPGRSFFSHKRKGWKDLEKEGSGNGSGAHSFPSPLLQEERLERPGKGGERQW